MTPLVPTIGGITIRATNGALLVTRGKEIPHKLTRVEGRKIENNDIQNLTKIGISIKVKIDNMAALPNLMKVGETKN